MKVSTLKQLFLTAVAVFGFGACAQAQNHNVTKSQGISGQTMDVCSYPTYKVVDDGIVLEFGYIDGINRCVYDPPYAYAFYNFICGMSNDTILVQGCRPSGDSVDFAFSPSYGGQFLVGAYELDTLHDFGNGEWYEDIHPMYDAACVSMNLEFELEDDDVAYMDPYCQSVPNTDAPLGFVNECMGTQCIMNRWAAGYNPDEFNPLTYLGVNGEAKLKVSWTKKTGEYREHRFVIVFDNTLNPENTPPHANSVSEGNGTGRLGVFPNPTDGTFAIEAGNITKVEIFDLAGQKVLTDNSGNRTINAGSLPTGVYFLKVETQNGTKYGKLIKK